MTFSDNVSGIIDDIELQRSYDKAILKHRFLDEITYYEKKRDETKRYYNVFRFIVTTGSILLPAVLSMGQMDPTKLPKNFDMFSYWCSSTFRISYDFIDCPSYWFHLVSIDFPGFPLITIGLV